MSSLMGNSGYRGPTGQAAGLKGTGYKQVTSEAFTPEQFDLFKQLFSHVSPDSSLSRLAGGDQSQFSQLEEPAMRQFGQLQGQIANRFSGASGTGQLGARNGSGFNNAQNTAASQFAQDLQSQRLGIQRQAMMDLMGMSNSLLGQRPYETSFFEKQQKQPSFLESLLGSIIPGFGSAAGQQLGARAGGFGNQDQTDLLLKLLMGGI